MPTLKRREWVPCPPPEDLKPTEEVFVVRLTGEVLRDYKSYVEKMTEYRAEQWACKYTGKSGLTFKGALEEEERSRDLLKEVGYPMQGCRDARSHSRPDAPCGPSSR